MTESPKLLVVIVNYRTAGLTVDCLRSLEPEVKALGNVKVVVADNNSGDNSVVEIAQAISSHNWQDWVTLMPLERNGGYAYGNNAVINKALNSSTPPDYFLLLNPDTIVRPQALEILVDFMDQNPNVGMAGSRLEDPDGTPQCSAFRFQNLLSELDGGLRLGIVSKLLAKWITAPTVSDENCPTDWVSGASLIIRRGVFQQIGLLDEEYFMYFEEEDFCLAAQKAGWSCWYIPASRVVHLVGQSSGIVDTKKPQKRLPTYWFDSRQRFFVKNYGQLYTIITDLVWIVAFSLWRIRRSIQKKPDKDPPYFLEDFIKNSWIGRFLKTWQNQTSESSLGGLWHQIKEDWQAHGCDWTKPGFRAIAVYRLGVWRMTIQPLLLRAPLSVFYRALYRKIRNSYGIELPYSATLGKRVIIEHQSGIIIHGNSIIGDDSIIRQGVTIGNRYLDRPFAAPILGKRVNVGAGAKILGNVTIGDDACIGANAVVLADIPAGATAVGIPAKIIATKGEKLCQKLESLSLAEMKVSD